MHALLLLSFYSFTLPQIEPNKTEYRAAALPIEQQSLLLRPEFVIT